MRRLGWFLALTVVLLASCGGKGSSTTTATTATSGVPTSGTTATTVPTFSGSKNSKHCQLARQFSQSLNLAQSTDPKTLFQQFDSLASQYVASVPPEIKNDANTVINAIRQVEAKLKPVNYDVAKVPATELAADLAPVQDPKFTAALTRIDAYDSQVCGLTTTTT